MVRSITAFGPSSDVDDDDDAEAVELVAVDVELELAVLDKILCKRELMLMDARREDLRLSSEFRLLGGERMEAIHRTCLRCND